MLSSVRGCLTPIARFCSKVSDSSVNYSKNFFSTSSFIRKDTDDIKNGIVVTRDGSTIVCWHPEEPFPYEFSKPLPEEQPTEVSSVLKVQNKDEIMSVFKEKPQQFVIQDLCKITFTSKHRWAKRKVEYFRKRNALKRSSREWL